MFSHYRSYGVAASDDSSIAAKRAREICESKVRDGSCTHEAFFSNDPASNIGNCIVLGEFRYKSNGSLFSWYPGSGFGIKDAENNLIYFMNGGTSGVSAYFTYKRIAAYCL